MRTTLGKRSCKHDFSLVAFLSVVVFSFTSTVVLAQVNQSSERLRVLVGKSLVINSPEPLVRVSVTNPEIASAVSVTERQVLIHGHQAGERDAAALERAGTGAVV